MIHNDNNQRSLLVKRLRGANELYRLSDEQIEHLMENLSDADVAVYCSEFASVKELAEWISLLMTNKSKEKTLPTINEVSTFEAGIVNKTKSNHVFTRREIIEMMICFNEDTLYKILNH